MKKFRLLLIVPIFLIASSCSTTKHKDRFLIIKYEILDFEECSWKFIPDIIDPRYPGDFYVMLRPEYNEGVYLFPLNIDPKTKKEKAGFIRTNIKYNCNTDETMYLTLLDEDELSKGINELFSNITLEAGVSFFKLKKSTDSVAILNEWVVCANISIKINNNPPTKAKPLKVDFEKIILWLYYESL